MWYILHYVSQTSGENHPKCTLWQNPRERALLHTPLGKSTTCTEAIVGDNWSIVPGENHPTFVFYGVCFVFGTLKLRLSMWNESVIQIKCMHVYKILLQIGHSMYLFIIIQFHNVRFQRALYVSCYSSLSWEMFNMWYGTICIYIYIYLYIYIYIYIAIVK